MSAGTAVTSPVNAVPDYFKLPLTLRITKGAVNTDVSCTGRTPTTFTGCTSTPANTVGIALPATISGNVTTPDGVVVNVSTPLTVARPANAAGQTITVGAAGTFNTAPFAPNNHFWVTGSNNLIHCTGYTTAPALTGCNVSTNIATNATLSTSSRFLAGTGSIGGFIKIELQDTNNALARRDARGPELRHQWPEPSGGARAVTRRRTPSSGCSVFATTTKTAEGTCSYAGSLEVDRPLAERAVRHARGGVARRITRHGARARRRHPLHQHRREEPVELVRRIRSPRAAAAPGAPATTASSSTSPTGATTATRRAARRVSTGSKTS